MIGSSFFIYAAIFISLTLFTYGVLASFGNRRAIQERIETSSGGDHSSLLSKKKENPLRAWVSQLLMRWGNRATKDPESLLAVRQQLIYAGFRQTSAPLIYLGLRFLCAMLLPLPYLLSQIVQGTVNKNSFFSAFLFAGLGYVLPLIFLKIRVRKRQNNIDRALPDVLDLFIICAEAGLSLPATINKVTGEIKDVSPDFYQELQIAVLELRTGLSWDQVLHRLGERTGVMSVKSFVALLVQTDKLGTNIAQAMRTQANFIRTQRMLKAEELANKLPLKMLFPLAFCIFPGIMIVAAGPGFIQIFRIMLPIFQGQ